MFNSEKLTLDQYARAEGACHSLEVIREVSHGPVTRTESGSLDIAVSASELSPPPGAITFKTSWTLSSGQFPGLLSQLGRRVSVGEQTIRLSMALVNRWDTTEPGCLREYLSLKQLSQVW